ncbi:aminopeptidase [Neolewinella antarctica]|uniref:Aminopeptidase n=1 Tax=Neolewinella antarctica TaxID=442734 RepID=A0ABX0XGV2_9BACT|nr:aminopeptidase [Neolewinella antarctica]NJC28441.1 aminopeptidase [Neolewinella antarctica]
MSPKQLQAYASLLVNYCVELQPGERLFVSSTTLAAPLIAALQEAVLKAGGHLEYHLAVEGSAAAYRDYASPEQYAHVGTLYQKAMEEFEAYINIGAPFSLRDEQPAKELRDARRASHKPFHDRYFARTANRDAPGGLKRNTCVFPCPALAEEAGMSLEEYTDFVMQATKATSPDPKAAWLDVRKRQQAVVDRLNSCTEFRYVNPRTDITFTTNGRTWINSDGQTNMPSGEVYTSPEETSVNGTIHFDYPAINSGKVVRGVTLTVKDGYIESWTAEQGQDVLDETFQIEGTRRFGEAAVGTNYTIDRFSKNILFDEKIGGTVHMAIGQSYVQCGGKNQSAVHWDMIADMKNGGRIFADGKEIYRDGRFIAELWPTS